MAKKSPCGRDLFVRGWSPVVSRTLGRGLPQGPSGTSNRSAAVRFGHRPRARPQSRRCRGRAAAYHPDGQGRRAPRRHPTGPMPRVWVHLRSREAAEAGEMPGLRKYPPLRSPAPDPTTDDARVVAQLAADPPMTMGNQNGVTRVREAASCVRGADRSPTRMRVSPLAIGRLGVCA